MNRRGILRTTALTGIALIAGCVNELTEPSTDEVKENAKSVAYQKLYRNISEYEGDPVYYGNLRITDIVSGQNTKEYLLMFNGGGFTDDRVLYGIWNGDPFQEQDNVELWGLVKGLKTYNSLGGEKTVPKIKIKAMNRA